MVADINPEGSSGPFPILDVNGTLFFSATDPVNGRELWKSDGTAAGTTLVKNIKAVGSSNPRELVNAGGTLFFSANDGVHGQELWKSDGSDAGTVLVRDIKDGAGNGLVFESASNIGALGTTVFFAADDGVNGVELWKSNGTTSGTVMVKNISQSGGSYPNYFIDVSGKLLFRADDGIHGAELWITDGSEEGTFMVSDLKPGIAGSFYSQGTIGSRQWAGDIWSNGAVAYFRNDMGLWKLDTTDLCPSDPSKIDPGVCGCGAPETDTDSDGSPNCVDMCPADSGKDSPGLCGCGIADTDSDGDGSPNCTDLCPNDTQKVNVGLCGCGTPDNDSDQDGVPNCKDVCQGQADTDSDGDGTPNCVDSCPNDEKKIVTGECGCGESEEDSDKDTLLDCRDPFPNDPLNGAGISINDGALFTNNVNVTLKVIAPVKATGMQISNDGGFRRAETRSLGDEQPWVLQSSGPERLPRTVYVRFLGPVTAPNFTDDIILDQTPPVLSETTSESCNDCKLSSQAVYSAEALSVEIGKNRRIGEGISANAKVTRAGRYRIKIRAKDNLSGLSSMQVGRSRGGRWIKFARTWTISARPGETIWTRVRDGAGNASRWRSVVLKR